MKALSPRVTRALEDMDCWRGPPVGDAHNYKEWQHFVVFGPGCTLVANFNLDGDGRGRVVLIRASQRWHGEITACEAPELRAGEFDASFGDAGMRWRSGEYQIWRHNSGADFEIALTPAAVPSLSHQIPLSPGAHLSWCVVPRLSASGWFETLDGRVEFNDCAAYHDHNWGRFRWGGDFSWDWGCAVPEDSECPWTLIFSRMNDRARRKTIATSAFLIRDGRHCRFFRNAEVSFTTEGALDDRPVRIPPAAALLTPDRDRDVPRVMRFEARRGADAVVGTVESLRRGQVLVPSETDIRRVVRLNEAETVVQVQGTIDDERVDFRGRGLLEVVRG